MKVACIYDVHGNLTALDAVLSEVETLGVDHIVVGGDMVPGPFPAECVARLRALEIPTSFIRGNGEREVVAFQSENPQSTVPEQIHGMLRWSGEQLDPETLDFITGLPLTVRLDIPPVGGVTFCHATVTDDTTIFTKESPVDRVEELFSSATDSVIVCGHTHMQFDRAFGKYRIVNAGSVGMTFGSDKAQWLLIGETIELKSTAYDRKQAAEEIRASEFPDAEQFVKAYIESWPSEEQMIKVYERSS